MVALIGDDAGMLWLSTHKGLCRFNPVTKEVRVFDEKDGLQSKEFTKACASGPNGELVVGCTNGFQTFQPARLRNNPYTPPVYIDRVTVLDLVYTFPRAPLTLSYQENVISFDFVALNFVAPEKNQYAYQLAGVNADWVYCGAQRTATYSFLDPGTYVFRVKAANNDGVWNEKGTALQLIILPPWWRTWWAYGLYGLLAIGSIWGFVWYRSRALRQENQVLRQKVAQRTRQVLEQSDEIKVQRDNLAQTLTNLEATQTQLIQAEKMASLGELTAGIAHEIQNPLNFVNNFSEVSSELLEELKEGPLARLPDADKEQANEILTDLTQNLQKINRHGQRASSIVNGMLEHSRSNGGEKRPTNLNKLVDEALRLAYHGMRAKDNEGSTGTASAAPPERLRFNCTLVTHFDPNLSPVLVVPQDMSRVFLNLFTNAFYALNQQGAGRRNPEETYQPTVTVSTQQVHDKVEISVHDNGIGMPEDVQKKIFQPFFTTKPPGQGTGLGLSLSYDIVTKGHAGELTVHSQEGEGAEFIVRIPLNRRADP